MDIIIHQSLCGENSKRAWDLLQTTLPDISIAKSIAFKTDLQDQAGGVSWKPTIRAFMQDDFFLIMKTFPDKSSNVRPGRAFSHVLLISKNDINSIVDIGSLFKYLQNEINKSVTIEPIKFNPKELSDITLPDGFQERFNKAIHGFKKSNEYKNTIIWVGEEYFEQAIFKFWKVLSPLDKETVNIGIYFNTVAIPKDKLNFITTPENIESKFLSGGFCLIRRNDTHILTDVAEQFLAGDASAGQRIQTFQDTLETGQLSGNNIDKIAIVIKTFEEIDSTLDLKRLNTLSHVIAEFSPDEKNGIAYKEKLINKISQLIENGNVTDIPLVKNFNLKCFKDAESKFSNAIINWLDNHIFSIIESEKNDFSTLFRQLRESTTSTWWTNLISERIKLFLAKIDTIRATVIFNWLKSDIASFNYIQSFINSSKESEKLFISQLPKNFDKVNFPTLREFAVKRYWYKFHSVILIREHPFETAIAEQLRVDTDYNSLDGIEVILHGIKPTVILDFTISNGDKRLIDIAGQYCKDEVILLNKIDFTNENWIKVWAVAISKGLKINDCFSEAQEKFFKLFDCILDGYTLPDIIWEKIGDSEFANILEYSNRETFWNKIPSKFKTKYLAKTSAILLESLHKNPTVEIPEDQTLSDYIIKYAIGDFLYYNPIKNALPIFNKYHTFPQNYITTYIKNYQANISAIEATQLGKLVCERNYKDVAYAIYYKANKSNNWKFALSECYYLLDFFTKAVIAIEFGDTLKSVNISTNQWWESAEEIICDLYPNGVSLATIWKKAGGKESELLINTTAENVWHDILLKLRNKGVKNVTMNSLLKEIKKTYGDNEKFKLIYQLRKNYITD